MHTRAELESRDLTGLVSTRGGWLLGLVWEGPGCLLADGPQHLPRRIMMRLARWAKAPTAMRPARGSCQGRQGQRRSGHATSQSDTRSRPDHSCGSRVLQVGSAQPPELRVAFRDGKLHVSHKGTQRGTACYQCSPGCSRRRSPACRRRRPDSCGHDRRMHVQGHGGAGRSPQQHKTRPIFKT